MAGKIFISYRRSDSDAVAHRMFDWLVEQFGPDDVFIDADRIPAGAEWRSDIAAQVRAASVVLVVIAETWLEALHARANDPNDVLRLEIETALAAGKPVIPVLIERMDMPGYGQLPPWAARLPDFNAARVSKTSDFKVHMERLGTRLAEGFGFRRVAVAGAARSAEPVVVDDPATRLWRNSKDSLEAKTYEQFLERHQNAAQSAEARQRLEDIYGWQRTDKTEPAKIHEYLMTGPIAPLATIAKKELQASKDKYVQKKAEDVRENLLGQSVVLLGFPFALLTAAICSHNFWLGHLLGISLNQKYELFDFLLATINVLPTFVVPFAVVGINYWLQRGEIKRAMDQRADYWKRELDKY